MNRTPVLNKTILVYTDGSCERKSRLGGLGIYMEYEGKEIAIAKGFKNTTVSRMELRAIIIALQLIKDKSYKLIITSDSEYTIKSINEGWLFNWERQNFIDRKNIDLWKLFLIEYRKFKKENLIFKHCKGHSGIRGNEICDQICSYKNFKVYEEDV